MDASPFGGDINDPDVRKAFDAKYNAFKDDRTPEEVLFSVAKKGSASRDDLELLAKLSEEGFYKLFMEHEGEDLTRMVRASLLLQTADPKAQEILAKAKGALIKIGKQSPINRRRIKKFEIEIPPEADDQIPQ